MSLIFTIWAHLCGCAPVGEVAPGFPVFLWDLPRRNLRNDSRRDFLRDFLLDIGPSSAVLAKSVWGI